MRVVQIIAAVILMGLGVLMFIQGMSVPAFIATPYLLTGVVMGGIGYLIYPKKKKTKEE